MIYKNEAKLQKKGIENMTIPELQQWIEVCIRNEENISHKKARHTWKESRLRAEAQIVKLST